MRRLLVATCMLASAGVADARPMLRPRLHAAPDPAELAVRLEAAIRARDAAALEGMLDDPMRYDSPWFADAACHTRFAGRGTLAGKDVRALARCLAQQKLVVSTRRSSLPRGAIITFDPGIELEVMFDDKGIAYLGRPHPTDATRAFPVLTVQRFEALRKTGTTQLDAVLAPQLSAPASAWIEVCLDKAGAVASSTVVGARPAAAGPAFLAATADWTFAPFKLRGTPAPACSFTLLSYPSASAPPVEVLPAPASLPAPVTRIRLDEDADFLPLGFGPDAPSEVPARASRSPARRPRPRSSR